MQKTDFEKSIDAIDVTSKIIHVFDLDKFCDKFSKMFNVGIVYGSKQYNITKKQKTILVIPSGFSYKRVHEIKPKKIYSKEIEKWIQDFSFTYKENVFFCFVGLSDMINYLVAVNELNENVIYIIHEKEK